MKFKRLAATGLDGLCLMYIHIDIDMTLIYQLGTNRPKANEARGGPKELSTDISALCLLQDLREAYLHLR